MPTNPASFLLRRRSVLGGSAAACLAAATGSNAAATVATGGRLARQRREKFLIGQDPATIAPPPVLDLAERFVDVPDGRIKYLDTGGSGEAVVLVHAATGTARSWDYQLGALHSAGYRVIAYWRRGTLASAQGAVPNNTLETQDLHALADGLGLKQFHLLGTASGGFIAIRFAVAHPQRLLSLTLANSLLGLNEPDYTKIFETLLPEGFQAMPSEFKELSASYRVGNPAGVQRWLQSEAGSLAAQLKMRPDMAAVMRAGVRGSDGPAFADLKSLNLPVHLMYGDADLYAPPALARILSRQFMASQLTILGESGHASHWEQPATFNAALIDFLKRNRSRARTR